jgi:hypothetical protein
MGGRFGKTKRISLPAALQKCSYDKIVGKAAIGLFLKVKRVFCARKAYNYVAFSSPFRHQFSCKSMGWLMGTLLAEDSY